MIPDKSDGGKGANHTGTRQSLALTPGLTSNFGRCVPGPPSIPTERRFKKRRMKRRTLILQGGRRLSGGFVLSGSKTKPAGLF